MRKSRRFLERNYLNRKANGRVSLFATMTLVAFLSGVLLYFTNIRQNEQVHSTYCGDFGLYGKSLVLMKDNTFRFHYFGCSQENGYVKGNWRIDKNFLLLTSDIPDERLDIKYSRTEHDLIPINLTNEKFTLCEYYEDAWERTWEETTSELTSPS